MERRQTVQENAFAARIFHDGPRHPVRRQIPDALLPDFIRLAHGYPDVGIDHIGSPRPGRHVVGQRDRGAGRGRVFPALPHQLRIREIALGRAGHEIQTHLRAGDHQGIPHVVAGVAHVNQFHALQMSEMFPNRQKIRQHLRRVVLIGQAVPDRHARVPGDLLDNLLPETAVFDALVDPAQHPGRIGDTLLLADLRAGRIQIRRPHPEVMGSHLKGTAGPGAGLLEDQRHILPPVDIHRNPLFLLLLKIRRQIQKICDLLRAVILQGQKMSSLQIHNLSFPPAVLSSPRRGHFRRSPGKHLLLRCPGIFGVPQRDVAPPMPAFPLTPSGRRKHLLILLSQPFPDIR